MRVLYSILLALPLLAVDGQVLNQTTGKPQGGATVTLFKAFVCPHCAKRFKEAMKFSGACGKSMEAGA